MIKQLTFVQILTGLFIVVSAQAAPPYEVRLKGDLESQIEKTSPYSLFFDPTLNEVRVDRQRMDYDLTDETALRLGPYLLDQDAVSMQMSREQGEYYDLEFGLEIKKKRTSIYVMSFNWPVDYVAKGVIEIVDDKARSLWRRQLTEEDIRLWANIVRNRAQVSQEEIENVRKGMGLVRPQNLSQIHSKSHFGLAHKGFFEVPISQIDVPFRFCLTDENYKGRLALCSRRYEFSRSSGQYQLKTLPPEKPIVLINDKTVTHRGTAIFIDNNLPIKFAARLKSGTYYEFVSHPKEIQIVDLVKDPNSNRINVIGYGDIPMGQINETFYADSVHWGFLNFMPTIGDLRKFWRANMTTDAPYLYLKGEGGAPFRQVFSFNALPTARARITLSDKTTKSTYSSSVWVKGSVSEEIKVDADGAEVNRLSPNEFEWDLPTPVSGTYNKGILNIYEGEEKWRGVYEIYRGYPADLGVRMSGVLTSDLNLVLLAEASFQYWFESVLGWRSYRFSHQRWGIAAKYFEAFIGTDESLDKLAVGNVDLKYRLTPGTWGRDPTVGLMLSAMNFDYGASDEFGSVGTSLPTVGGGVFWARSMPKIFDDIFNIVPFMRYPKWVDWEFIYYPITLREKQKSTFMSAMNFHGKVQWTKRFYGEAGFGLKNYSFEDTRSASPDKQLAQTIGVLYGTVGLGFNF